MSALCYVKAIGLVAGLTLATNLLGFVREIFMARAFGTTAEADAFVTAFTIVATFFLLFSAGTIQAAFMPLYQSLRQAGNANKAKWLFQVSFFRLTLLLLGIILLIVFASDTWVLLVVPGFEQELRDLTSQLVTWMAPMILLLGTGSMLQSLLHARNRFGLPATVPLINNVIIIIALVWLAPVMGIKSVAWAYLAGALLWWIMLIPANHSSFSLRDKTASPEKFREMLIIFWPLIILLSADQISALIQKNLVSDLQTGSIAALNYAAKLEGLPVGIFAMAIATVFFPGLVAAIANNDNKSKKQLFRNGLLSIVYISVPVMIVLFYYSEFLVRLLFERGAFDSKATAMTADALELYVLGLVPQSLIVFLNRVYFSAKETRIPMQVGVVAAILHVIFCWFAVEVMGYLGIALGTTLYAWVYVYGLVFKLNKIIDVPGNEVIRGLWPVVLAAVAMLSILALAGAEAGILKFLVVSVISFTVYLAFLYFFRPSFFSIKN